MRLTLLLLIGFAGAAACGSLSVFDGAMVHFAPEDSSRFCTERVQSLDRGRVASTRVALPDEPWPGKIFGHLCVEPIAKDSLTVWDRWDRAGNLRLAVPGHSDLELIKFVTAYGGPTEHRVELSHLAPLLVGELEFRAFVDTWSSPAWRLSFDLELSDEPNPMPSDWVLPLIYEEAVVADSGVFREGIAIPEGSRLVQLHYLVSGHCTDGTDADEFESKFNVVTVDGRETLRYKPWRCDCTRFRGINPFTRRWPDGTWSSDYSRSGWCPGDAVAPLVTDLRAELTPGEHTMSFAVEDVRPQDENGHHGTWRVSAYLVGWKE